MLKLISGFVVGIVLTVTFVALAANKLMIIEHPSPFGLEETAARIQANIQAMSDKGWKLSALRDPSKAVAADGLNVPPVLLVEACSTRYSSQLLKEDATRILSILMPCTITVYKKDNGKVYIGVMNSELMGRIFGSKVAAVMTEVAADQKKFLEFDASKPAPPLIQMSPGGGGGAGGGGGGGC